MAKPEQMKVPYQVASLETVPAPLRLFFTERDGAFHLNTDGDHPDSVKLSEFRTHNRALNAAKTELEAKLVDLEAKLKAYDGLDAEQARQALAQLAGLPEHEQKLKDATEALAREREAHRAARLAAEVTAAGMEKGVDARALEYITGLASRIFTVADGKVTTKMVDATGVPLTVATWLDAQRQALSFCFKPSKGGGAFTSSTKGQADARPTVSKNDPVEFGKHVEAIAKGGVRLVD